MVVLLTRDHAIMISVAGLQVDRPQVQQLMARIRGSVSLTSPRTRTSGRSMSGGPRIRSYRWVVRLGFLLAMIGVGGGTALRRRG